jgi:hypothetical protein
MFSTANYTIEEDWKSVVTGWSEMSERGRQQQTAIWELVETEVVYLKTVKVITDVRQTLILRPPLRIPLIMEFLL